MEAVRSVARATEIVETIARAGASGARLVDVVKATSLQKTTVHRIVTTLVDIGWLEQGTDDGAFRVGAKIIGLGSAALNRHGLADIASPRLLELARSTEDTVFLSVRSGTEALCVDRVLGSFPIRTLTLQVGDRRPLGVGAGSMALLAWQEPDEIEATLSYTSSTASHPRVERSALQSMIRQSVERGFTINDGMIVSGAFGVGVPVKADDGRAVAALSVAAITSRMPRERVEHVAELLVAEAGQLAEDLRDVTTNLSEPSIRRILPGHT